MCWQGGREEATTAISTQPHTIPTMNDTQRIKLKRALWLAFQASSAMGMGFLHASSAGAQDEDSLYGAYGPHTDAQHIDTDYVFGRMMKTTFRLNAQNELEITPQTPRLDYQSWALEYPTAADLIAAVELSLEAQPS